MNTNRCSTVFSTVISQFWMKPSAVIGWLVLLGAMAFFAPSAHAAGLDQMINGGNTLVLAFARLLTSIAALCGGWLVFSGVMTWKKSSNEHGGGQIEFKSVVIPIVAGVILVCFTGFILLTSTSFGFATPNTTMFQ